MLDINENMDELFRRAAKDYPLDSGTPDFNIVLQKMNAAPVKKDPGNDSKWLLLFWMLMLLPMALIHHFNPQQLKTGSSNHSSAVSQSSAVDEKELTHQHIAAVDPITNANEQSYGVQQQNTNYFNAGNDDNSFVSSNKKSTIADPKFAMSLSVVSAENSNPVENYHHTDVREEMELNESEAAFIPVDVSDDKITHQPEEIITETPEVPADTLVTPEKKEKNNKKRFYAGITGGADLTSIKMQSVKKTGYSVGIVAGYEINKKWSIETGLLYDKKYYSTDGKYFNPKYALPYNATIEYADGNCNMLELPINMRYNFNSDKKFSWYVLSGFSSYFMKEESYVYDVFHNGYRYPKAMEYNNPATSLFSVMNFGGGFSYRAGGFHFGLEPYIKLPLRKVGTGNLPLQSGGINLRITTKIF